MKKKAQKAYNWDAKIMAALRKVWRFSPERREALAAATHPENKQEVVCASCGSWVHLKLAKVDHVKPIVPVSGFDSWDAVIHRLRFGELQVLCEDCHKLKTKTENAERARIRREIKHFSRYAPTLYAESVQKACRKRAERRKNARSHGVINDKGQRIAFSLPVLRQRRKKDLVLVGIDVHDQMPRVRGSRRRRYV